MSTAATAVPPAAALEPRTGLYLAPHQLEPNDANERARPGESIEERQKRGEQIAHSIAVSGQIHPVLVVELDSDTEFDEEGTPRKRYEYVDGGARVDAVRMIADGSDVWCSIVDPASDLFRMALSANIHRTQNSILQMSEIISDVRERNGWNGRGGQQKVCEYLGLQQSQVSGYEKISRAPKAVRDLIASGEVGTVDAALKLMSVKPEELPLVTKRAQELAGAEEKKVVPAPVLVPPTPSPAVDAEEEETKTEAATAPTAAKSKKPAKVTAKHVQQAAREVGSTAVPLTRAELLAAFDELRGLPYPQAAKNFIEYLVDVHAPGKGGDREFERLFDAAVGFGVAAPYVPGEENEELSQKSFDLKAATKGKGNLKKKLAPKPPAKAKAVAKKVKPVKPSKPVKSAKAAKKTATKKKK